MVRRSCRLPFLLGAILLGGAGPAAAQQPPEGSAPESAAPGSPASGSPVPGDVRPTGPSALSAGPATAPGAPSAAAVTSQPTVHAAGRPTADAIPPQLAEDRADAIAHDMVLHPPQKLVPPQSAFRLLTARHRLGGLLDRSVRGAENSQVGRVIDVMIGDDGHPAALELDVGGFMGVGNRKIAVAWGLFDLSKPEGSDPLRVALTEAQVKSAPAVEESGPVTVVTGANAASPAAPTPHETPAGASNPADGSRITGPAPGPVLSPPAGPGTPAAPPASDPADGSAITPPARLAAPAGSSTSAPQPAPAVAPPEGSAVPRPAPPATAPIPKQRS